ncbi:hypothetical protein ACHAWF_012392 [Thalassiosira exigua]
MIEEAVWAVGSDEEEAVQRRADGRLASFQEACRSLERLVREEYEPRAREGTGMAGCPWTARKYTPSAWNAGVEGTTPKKSNATAVTTTTTCSSFSYDRLHRIREAEAGSGTSSDSMLTKTSLPLAPQQTQPRDTPRHPLEREPQAPRPHSPRPHSRQDAAARAARGGGPTRRQQSRSYNSGVRRAGRAVKVSAGAGATAEAADGAEPQSRARAGRRTC